MWLNRLPAKFSLRKACLLSVSESSCTALKKNVSSSREEREDIFVRQASEIKGYFKLKWEHIYFGMHPCRSEITTNQIQSGGGS